MRLLLSIEGRTNTNDEDGQMKHYQDPTPDHPDRVTKAEAQEYLDLHNARIRAIWRDKDPRDFFYAVTEQQGEHGYNGDIHFEIRGHESRSGNPESFWLFRGDIA
jgi:hypothetical protein